MRRPVPSKEDLLSLAEEALSNAETLLEDALLLAEAGHFPRAYALAALACEEVAKSDHCARAMWILCSPEWFWERFNSHHVKLDPVHTQAILASGEFIASERWFSSRVRDGSRSAHIRKLRGLYVDFRNGAIQTPEEIGQQEALDMIDAAKTIVGERKESFSRKAIRVRALSELSLEMRVVILMLAGWAVVIDSDLVISFLRQPEIIVEPEFQRAVVDLMHKFAERLRQVGLEACLAEIAEQISLPTASCIARRKSVPYAARFAGLVPYSTAYRAVASSEAYFTRRSPLALSCRLRH